VELAPGRHHIQTNLSGPVAVDHLDLVAAVRAEKTRPRSVSVEAWGPVTRALRIGAGPAAVLTTSENWNAGWHATMAGHRLTPVRLDGWRQGWRVPGGPGGRIRLTFGPARPFRSGLIAGAAGVLLVLVLALVTRRPRRDWPQAAERRVPSFVLGAVAALAVWLVAGPVVAAVPLLVVASVRTGDDDLLPTLAALVYAGAGLLVVLQPGRFPGSGAGAYSVLAQVLTGVSLAAVASAVLVPGRR
jgi:arabinofuranan 3-O-arabinosyltransferase